MLRTAIRRYPLLTAAALFGLNCLLFFYIQTYVHVPAHHIYSRVDELIPFNRYFVIPYFSWHAELFLIEVYYWLKKDMDGFEKMTLTLNAGYLLSSIIFLLFPSYINLRPAIVYGDDLCAHLVRFLYVIDDSRNVCPSLHVSFCVIMMLIYNRGEHNYAARLAFNAWNVTIMMSTLFLRQHSVIDFMAGIIFGLAVDGIVQRALKKAPDLALQFAVKNSDSRR